LKTGDIFWRLKRHIFPFGAANRASEITMLDIVSNAIEVERVRTLSIKDGLALPFFQTRQANGTFFL
jgi:hypothetical protein